VPVAILLPGTSDGQVAGRRVFACAQVTFTVADLARRARVGERAPSGDSSPGPASPDAVEEAFRRSRGLLTADRLEAWLAGWAITPEDFRRWTTDVATGTGTATGWCTLLCSGDFDSLASAVAEAAAAACELGAAPTDAAGFDPDGWVERLVAARTHEEDLAAAAAANRLGWTALDLVVAVAPRRGAAEELRHQVLHDGRALADVAEPAGCTLRRLGHVALAELHPPTLRAVLAGARAGELLGPVPAPEGWALVDVLERTAPSLDDPATRARAEAAVRRDVVARALARHVVA
jgi:hypothetical protein